MIEQTRKSGTITGLFTEHPSSVGETYFQHLRFAWKISRVLFGAAFAAAIHGIFPALFEDTASKAIKNLHANLSSRR